MLTNLKHRKCRPFFLIYNSNFAVGWLRDPFLIQFYIICSDSYLTKGRLKSFRTESSRASRPDGLQIYTFSNPPLNLYKTKVNLTLFMVKAVFFICNNQRITANDKTPPMMGEFGIGTYRMYFKKGSQCCLGLIGPGCPLLILYKARLLHIFFSFSFLFKTCNYSMKRTKSQFLRYEYT